MKALGPLALLPVLYLMGFIAWGSFAAWQGLGYLQVDPGRYLAAGAIMLAPIALGGTLWWFAAVFGNVLSHARRDRWPTHLLRVALEAVVMVLAMSLPIVITAETVRVWPVFDTRLAEMYLPLLETAGYLGIVYLMLSGAVQVLLRFLRDEPDPVGTHMKPRGKAHVIGGAAFLAFFQSFLWGFVVLAVMNPAFGGAHVRSATLELERQAFDDATVEMLGGNVTRDGPVFRTRALDISFYDDRRMMVDMGDQGALEIDRVAIRAIHWHDDSRFYRD